MTVNANEVIEDDADEDVEDQQVDQQVTEVAQLDEMPEGSLIRYHMQRYYKASELWGTVYESGERSQATINSTSFNTAITRGSVFIVNDTETQMRILRDLRQAMEQALADVKAERDAAIATVTEKQTEVEAKDRRFDEMVETLHEKAIEKDYCGDFDEVMEELGLPARPREYDVRWKVTYYVTTPVRSTNEGEAHSEIERDEIYEAVRESAEYPDSVEHQYTELS